MAKDDTTPSYDTTEALEMLAAFAEKTNPDKVGAEKAADALLDSLLELGKSVKDVEIEKAPGTGKTRVLLITAKRTAWVEHSGGEFEISKGWGRGEPEPSSKAKLAGLLSYNPTKKILEGSDAVKLKTPSPGAPPARRSALAIVLDRMLDLIRPDWEPATEAKRPPIPSPQRRM